MGDHNFIKIKNDILDFIKTQTSFKECFVVRNIFSRFAVYIVAPKDFEQFKNAINERFSDCIDLIQVISKQDDSFIYYDLKNTSTPVSDTVFFSERHTENTNWFIKEQYKLATSVTSFYSFKGGVGRTTATILTALLLARAGKKVLVIDFDLEAPGLASVFANQDDDTEDLLKVKGFVDFIIDFDVNKRDFEKINLDNYYFVRNEQILVGTKGGEIVIVPAIATDSANASAYIDKLSKANIKFEKNRDYIPDIFLKKMEDKIKPDFILIDTRTGINDVGGLVFNRYAQNIFLIFYGNKQNMFGLESILPELKKLNEEKNVQFYLVNSPVPKNPTDERAEVDFFVESSYDLFCQYFYDIDRLPSQFDESEVHFPIPIHFNDQALILNNFKKIASIIESPNNEYLKIANIILNSKEDDTIKQVSTKSENESNKELLDSIVKIDKGFGASELEYQDENDLTKYFYPRKDYKYIFDKSKFLILGDKGVGKTALFSVLSHTNYAKALSKFCGVDAKEIDNTTWVIGLDKDKPEFPNKTNFERLTDCSIPELRNYWIVLLLRQVIKLDNTLVSNSPLVEDIIGNKIKDLKDIAKRSNIGEDLFEILKEFNQNLKTKGATYIFVYDHLDAVLPSEGDLRGKLASALLSIFYDNINTLSHIKAKIFLRNDIFDREVKNITDKVKIQNYSVKIQWEYNQLLNIIWKRIYEQDKKSVIFKAFEFPTDGILGSIPNLIDHEHTTILNKIFGVRMGGNNKTYPYNWVKLHIEDTNGQIHPRTLIKLFAESARLQKEDTAEQKDRIIRSKNIEDALRTKVSKHQVEELTQEYKELEKVFKNLSDNVGGSSPMIESVLIAAIKSLDFENPLEIVDKLKAIGLLKDYKSTKNKDGNNEKRYHIPDLYLYGLNFTRKGTR